MNVVDKLYLQSTLLFTLSYTNGFNFRNEPDINTPKLLNELLKQQSHTEISKIVLVQITNEKHKTIILCLLFQ